MGYDALNLLLSATHNWYFKHWNGRINDVHGDRDDHDHHGVYGCHGYHGCHAYELLRNFYFITIYSIHFLFLSFITYLQNASSLYYFL
jgi:hypothetical protein